MTTVQFASSFMRVVWSAVNSMITHNYIIFIVACLLISCGFRLAFYIARPSKKK